MKIKTKLLLGLSMLTILTFFLVGVGWFQLFSVTKMEEDLKISYEISSLSNEIQRKVKDQAISLRNIIAFSDKELVQKDLEYLRNESDSILEDILSLESMVVVTEQRFNVEELKDMNRKFSVYVDVVIKFASEGNWDEATRTVMNNGYKMQDDYFQVISRITNASDVNMDTSLIKLENDFKRQLITSSVFSILGIIIGIGFVFKSVWSIAIRLNKMSSVMSDVANGKADLSKRLEAKSVDEIDDVARSFNYMAVSLEEQRLKEQYLSKENQDQAWSKSNVAEITGDLNGMHELELISQRFLSKTVPLVQACQAAFYMKDVNEEKNETEYKLIASYAFKERKHFSNIFSLGEGLVGQAALEKKPILLTDVPTDYISIKSALGEGTPLNIYVLPVIYQGDVKAVIEIASFIQFNAIQQTLLEELVSNLGIILDNTMGRIMLAKLLNESQVMTEELQAQSEELQTQQEELRATNEELETQTHELRNSEERLQFQQEELEQTNSDLKEKAEILEHQNKKFEATNKEVEKARAELEEKAKQLALSSKYKSEFLANMSHELRTPLNSLLILSKILSDNPDGNLTEKQIEFSKTIYSSSNDLLMIINDILDLAKIESGKKEVNVSAVYIEDLANYVQKSFKPLAFEKNVDFNIVLHEGIPSCINSDEQQLQQVLKNLLSNAFKFTSEGKVTLEIGLMNKSNHPPIISFSVIDTGIGIPKEKQELIFQAFQQADGTTSRKYGGTGLGLSICMEIATLLGGEIEVESEEGKGSTFTFYIADYQESEKRKYRFPNLEETAVSLETIEKSSLKDKLINEETQNKFFEPSYNIKRFLIVDQDLSQRNSLMELIGDKNVIITAVSNGAEAIEALKVSRFDCMLLDLELSDTTGFELLERIKSDNMNEQIDVFIYTGCDLTAKEELYLQRYAHAIIIKDSHSPQRLMEELELYFNSSSVVPHEDKVPILKTNGFNGLEDKKVLIVDDDVRNVYALSNVLEMNGMKVKFAENGIECLKTLGEISDFDLVLMDIMMPEMDGYETMQRIRSNPKFSSLPIIALTAKAMKEDREKCMEAGASDYIVKPVITDQLLSLIRVWLHPEGVK